MIDIPAEWELAKAMPVEGCVKCGCNCPNGCAGKSAKAPTSGGGYQPIYRPGDEHAFPPKER